MDFKILIIKSLNRQQSPFRYAGQSFFFREDGILKKINLGEMVVTELLVTP